MASSHTRLTFDARGVSVRCHPKDTAAWTVAAFTRGGYLMTWRKERSNVVEFRFEKLVLW